MHIFLADEVKVPVGPIVIGGVLCQILNPNPAHREWNTLAPLSLQQMQHFLFESYNFKTIIMLILIIIKSRNNNI